MAQDADGNYYYDEGTIADQMDSWDIYEDADGNIGMYNGTGEVRIHELAYLFGAPRANPDTDELADGEQMIYVSDGTGANSSADDLVVAKNDGGTITEAVLAATADHNAV